MIIRATPSEGSDPRACPVTLSPSVLGGTREATRMAQEMPASVAIDRD